VRRIVEQHESGSHYHSAPLWSLLMFDAFLRQTYGERRVAAVA
jgi:asparagine synthase (glutamine-hydrolysing)